MSIASNIFAGVCPTGNAQFDGGPFSFVTPLLVTRQPGVGENHEAHWIGTLSVASSLLEATSTVAGSANIVDDAPPGPFLISVP
jgi:hypothetical protein